MSGKMRGWHLSESSLLVITHHNPLRISHNTAESQYREAYWLIECSFYGRLMGCDTYREWFSSYPGGSLPGLLATFRCPSDSAVAERSASWIIKISTLFHWNLFLGRQEEWKDRLLQTMLGIGITWTTGITLPFHHVPTPKGHYPHLASTKRASWCHSLVSVYSEDLHYRLSDGTSLLETNQCNVKGRKNPSKAEKRWICMSLILNWRKNKTVFLPQLNI